MDFRLWEKFHRVKETLDNCASVNTSRYLPQLWRVLWRFPARTWMRTYARWQGSRLWLTTATTPRGKLPYSWFGVGRGGSCFKNLETLPHWKKVPNFYRPQKSQIHIYSAEFKSLSMKMAWVSQGLNTTRVRPTWLPMHSVESLSAWIL